MKIEKTENGYKATIRRTNGTSEIFGKDRVDLINEAIADAYGT